LNPAPLKIGKISFSCPIVPLPLEGFGITLTDLRDEYFKKQP
jgi:hypothetical protein